MFTLQDILQGNESNVRMLSAATPDPAQIFPPRSTIVARLVGEISMSSSRVRVSMGIALFLMSPKQERVRRFAASLPAMFPLIFCKLLCRTC